jgi:hypothetical protein
MSTKTVRIIAVLLVAALVLSTAATLVSGVF